MARNSNSSLITIIAITVSVVLSLALGYLLMKPEAPAPTTPAETVANAQPAATPTSTDVPATNPAATPSATTATDTSDSLTAKLTPTPEPTPAGSPGAEPVKLTGTVEGYDGSMIAEANVYVIEKALDTLPESIRFAFGPEKKPAIYTTDALGFFEAKIESGKKYFVGLMIGGEPQQIAVEVEGALPGQEIEATLTMPRPIEITGRVSNQSGEAVAGIPIMITWKTQGILGSIGKEQKIEITTSDKGVYTTSIQEPLEVSVFLDGEKLPDPYLKISNSQSINRETVVASRRHRIDFEIRKGTVLTGVVKAGPRTEKAGLVIPGAHVFLDDLTDSRTATLELSSDDEGRFRVSRIRPDIYKLTVHVEDYARSTDLEFDLNEDRDLIVEMNSLLGVGLQATFPDATGPDARVQFSIQDRHSGEQSEKVTFVNHFGEVKFANLDPGRYLASATIFDDDRVIGYGEITVDLEEKFNDSELQIPIVPLETAKGRIYPLQEHVAPEDLVLTLQDLGKSGADTERWSHPEWRQLPTGKIAPDFNVEASNLVRSTQYLLCITHRKTAEVLAGKHFTGGNDGHLDLVLVGTGTVRGRVLDDKGGACSGVTIRVTSGLTLLEGVPNATEDRETVTSFDGTFSFESVRAGSARVMIVSQPDSWRLVTVPRKSSLNMDMACKLMVAIDLVLKEPTANPFKEKEQFLLFPQAGSTTKTFVKELQYGNLALQLEPGTYTLTRTSTMESRNFEVHAKFDGQMVVDFSQAATP